MKIWEWSGDANEHTPLFYDSANGKASRGNWKVTSEVKGLLQRILGLYHISRNLCIRYFSRVMSFNSSLSILTKTQQAETH